MQYQQDMGKTCWLSTPTLVDGLSLSTPGTTGLQKQGSSSYTSALHSPKISRLKTPWGTRKPHHTTVGAFGALGAYNP